MDEHKTGGDPSAEKPASEITALERTSEPIHSDDLHHSESIYPPVPVPAGAGGGSLPPPPDDDEDEEEDGDGEGMLRMSFMGHLEELRSRIIKALAGWFVCFLGCLVFSIELWEIVQQPGLVALQKIGGEFIAIDPLEQFSIIWIWTPMVASFFLGAPWVIYQVWAFIAPGLYKRERRWAVPFIGSTAGLFIAGGAFAYFVAFRYGLAFLLAIGTQAGVRALISIDKYFSLFVNVMLGVALIFELPVLIFFLTLIRVASPSFLLRHSRYAILAIVILAAVITPTPDFFNLTLFAVPMVLLYFLGVFASYLLVLRRENRQFPWRYFLYWVGVVVALTATGVAIAILRFGYHWHWPWPLLVR